MDKTYFLLSLSIFLVFFHGSLGRRTDRHVSSSNMASASLIGLTPSGLMTALSVKLV